jgi:hypothetical protein
LNLSTETAEQVTLRVVRDPDPTREIREVLSPGLQEVPGFQRISNRVQPQGFNLQLPDFPDATVTDNSHLGCLGLLLYLFSLLLNVIGVKLVLPEPKCEAQVQLRPGQSTTLTFETNLSDAARGDAFVYYLMQVGQNQRIQGGLTLVMVAV